VNLKEFSDLLNTVCDNVYHFDEADDTDIFPRIVFAETDCDYTFSSNGIARKDWKVDVHFYTREEYDPIIEKLDDAFVKSRIPFKLTEISYGQSPGHINIIYYKFECEV
jgi:hypothetical protein